MNRLFGIALLALPLLAGVAQAGPFGPYKVDAGGNLWFRVKPGGHYVIEVIAGENEIAELLIAAVRLTGRPGASVNLARNLMVITCPTSP